MERGETCRRLDILGFRERESSFSLKYHVRGRLIGPKPWDRIVINFGAIFTVHGLCAWTVWAICVMIYVLNHVVMCVRPRSAEKYGFTK